MKKTLECTEHMKKKLTRINKWRKKLIKRKNLLSYRK